MLKNYMICDNGLENCYQGENVFGYRLKIGLPYYRSLPLSCIEDIKLFVDSSEIDSDSLTLELDNQNYGMSELNRMDIWWDFCTKGYLNVSNVNGLEKGFHQVKVYFKIRVPYLIPVGNDFVVNYDITNAEKIMEVRK